MPKALTCKHGVRPKRKCKECYRVYKREYYRSNEERRTLCRARSKKYYYNQFTDNPVRMRFQSILRNSRRRKRCEITVGDLLLLWKQQNSRCVYCGTEMTYERGGRKPTSVSIDRINSSVHYTTDNVVLACWACNSGKGTMTPEEYIKHCKKVAQQHRNG